jgi:hypothetical protein
MTARRRIASRAGRDPPLKAGLAIHRHHHALVAFIDLSARNCRRAPLRTRCRATRRARLSASRWGRARQASDASAAWSRERRGVMRARGIEGVGATPAHRSAVSRPGLREVIAQSQGPEPHRSSSREHRPSDPCAPNSVPCGCTPAHRLQTYPAASLRCLIPSHGWRQ